MDDSAPNAIAENANGGWRQLRYLLIAVAFFVGLVIPFYDAYFNGPDRVFMIDSRSFWTALPVSIIGLFMFPVMLAGIVWVQQFNRSNDQMWARPTSDSNPFRLGNPLLPLHFLASVVMSASLGMMVALATLRSPIAVLAAICTLYGPSIHIGIYIAMRVCRRKIADHN